MRITRQLVLAGAILSVGVAIATTGVLPADAGRCELWNSSITVVNDGDCYYTNDTVGPIVVTTMLGGTINGGSGADSVAEMYGGQFNGGNGNDVVGYMQGGTFNGGAGDDRVSGSMFAYDAPGPSFNGGTGNDYVGSLFWGTFNGGPGDDTVGYMPQVQGTFSGGPGADAVISYCYGTVWSATYDVNTCL